MLWLNGLIEKFTPPFVLIILLIYTYAELWQAPYVGFNFSGSNGEIGPVFTESLTDGLQSGDQLIEVNDVLWRTYVADACQPIFPEVSVGETLILHVMQSGQPVMMTWPIRPPSVAEVLDRVVNVWWLGYIFWFTGTLTVLLVRPKDDRWRLLIAFYYFTAIWLVVGNASRWHLWESAIILRVMVWLSLPVYLHLHWIFPEPLGTLPRFFWPVSYFITFAVALIQWFQWLPRTAYLYGFLAAIGLSLLLLILRWFLHPRDRVAIRLLLWASGFAFLPILGINLAHAYEALPWFGPIGLIGLIPIPAAYFYAVYRYQLGRLELRTNRLIALFLFVMLTTTIIVLLSSVGSSFMQFPGDVVLFSLITAVGTVIIAVVGFPSFQHFVERRFLGIHTSLPHLLESYASRIGTRLTLPDLTRLLRHEVLPNLLVRQSALIWITSRQKWDVLYYDGVKEEQISTDAMVLHTYSDEHMQWQKTAPGTWVRLALPLRVENKVIGYWLLGRRDPDDFYSQTELTLFQALADQTAIALINIEQAEQLRRLYEANVDRHEVERTHLAMVLHDDVLHQMAILALTLNGGESTVEFDQVYSAVTVRIRQLITGLRPAMLTYGLGAAVEEFVDALMERANGSVRITCQITDNHIRVESKVEQYLFRIVQQAGENALRHAHAHAIAITGSISEQHVVLMVEDDGIGFPFGNTPDLNSLLATKHFGIVGMYERATIIGAKLLIDSLPNHGMRVSIIWPLDSAG